MSPSIFNKISDKLHKSNKPATASGTTATPAKTETPAAASSKPAAAAAATTTPAATSTQAPTLPKTSTMAPISTDDYLKAVEYRRTVYGITNKLPAGVDDERVISIIKRVQLSSPSSYNTQPGRITILLGAQHVKLWETILEVGLPMIKQYAGEEVEQKLKGMWSNFKGAYGSVLFWEDQATNKKAGETHQASAQMFPEWSVQADGMAQIQVWTALELEGLGVNVQHVNALPPVEDAIRKTFNIPADYKLHANMNFGAYVQDHPERPSKMSVEDTVTVHKG